MSMNKLLLIVTTSLLLAGCSQTSGQAEDAKLRQAYSACINTAEGSPDKLASC